MFALKGESLGAPAKATDGRSKSNCSTEWTKPTGDDYAGERDTMLMYFTSGTASHPKMVIHDYTLPIGHIVTAKYWQRVEEGTRHLTAVDSGWAKFAWGKI